MCGISGHVSLRGQPLDRLRRKLELMNKLQAHRGPDGEGVWLHPRGHGGFAHRRLSILDLSTAASQPMTDGHGNWIVFNGEIYNYVELREQLGKEQFRTTSDTEAILHAYRKWGRQCLTHLRGMFAFALWDESAGALFCARDRFGIKPFYYAECGEALVFASECKAILPFLPSIDTDLEALKDYLAFQFCLAGKTLFKGIRELLPGHCMWLQNGRVEVSRYWEVYYTLDWDHTAKYFYDQIRELMQDSVRLHLRSDVPLGAYVSGGTDSSIVAALASGAGNGEFLGFNGKFAGPDYDESQYARALGDKCKFKVHEIEISASDFIANIQKVIYHLDYPVAGPGSFPQYMVSQLAAKHRKVVLGGQGGDEIFGGYTRYLLAYFEQCIKAAIDGTMNNGHFIVTYESIIPNLVALRNYKPMLQEFWREGLFEERDKRYFRLINRAPLLGDEINWELLHGYSPYETFREIFNGDNVQKESYFDQMTHFDFKTLLPALLQVEDRVSMAHGLESRVPFLDHPVVECAATIPANIKFRDGTMKEVLKNSMGSFIPEQILNRKDKMGFPVPLNDWVRGECKDFVRDILASKQAQGRAVINNRKVLEGLDKESKFGRKVWGLLCLELWQRAFHDQQHVFKQGLES
jgi:asparagine synthase (glutamine-hydrolysing)